MFRGVSFLELLQFRLGVWLLPRTGQCDGPVLFGGNRFWPLRDHDLKVIESFPILSQPELRNGPSCKPGFKIVRLGPDLFLRTLKVTLGTLSRRFGFARPVDRYVDKQLVAQVGPVLLEVSLEMVSIRLTCDGGSRGPPPNAAISRRDRQDPDSGRRSESAGESASPP